MKMVFCGKTFLGVNCVGFAQDIIRLMKTPIDLYVLPVSADDGNDSWEPSLRGFAARRSIPLIGSLDDLELSGDDVVVSLEYDRLLRMEQLRGARSYNIHFSALPAYRGALTSYWPIYNGEKITGVTLHAIAPGVDDGDIVDQLLFEIPTFCTAFDLYILYNRYGYELFKSNLQRLITGREFSLVAQSSRRVSEYRRASVDYARIEITDFNLPAIDVQNQIRALIFPPYQLPLFRGKAISSVEVVSHPGTVGDENAFAAPPGTILVKDFGSAIVSCLDNPVRFTFQSWDRIEEDSS
ncbi:MAG: hypothetical protein HS115_10160 [Spirochaetales bacterium]|nr:hypothetical protein [Spirochaetales bacterium]